MVKWCWILYSLWITAERFERIKSNNPIRDGSAKAYGNQQKLLDRRNPFTPLPWKGPSGFISNICKSLADQSFKSTKPKICSLASEMSMTSPKGTGFEAK